MTLSYILVSLLIVAFFLMVVATIQTFRGKILSSSLCIMVGTIFVAIVEVIKLVGGVK